MQSQHGRFRPSPIFLSLRASKTFLLLVFLQSSACSLDNVSSSAPIKKPPRTCADGTESSLLIARAQSRHQVRTDIPKECRESTKRIGNLLLPIPSFFSSPLRCFNCQRYGQVTSLQVPSPLFSRRRDSPRGSWLFFKRLLCQLWQFSLFFF